MRFSHFLGVLRLAVFAIGAPTTSKSNSTTMIDISLFTNEQCNQYNVEDAATMRLSNTECHVFKGKWGSLKVEMAGEKLKYNSLHVFETGDCSGPWTLEPIKCGGEKCACSRITPYKSIQIVVS